MRTAAPTPTPTRAATEDSVSSVVSPSAPSRGPRGGGGVAGGGEDGGGDGGGGDGGGGEGEAEGGGGEGETEGGGAGKWHSQCHILRVRASLRECGCVGSWVVGGGPPPPVWAKTCVASG